MNLSGKEQITGDIDRFLLSMASRVESHRDFLRLHEPELAPFFNSFDYINPDENALSDIIAELLNPKGRHGQGEIFLQLFLALDSVRLTDKINPLDGVVIRREKTTDDNRRIDIVVSQPGKFGIGIENKPWAKDQENQVADYIADLKKNFGDKYCFIYLSSQGADPSIDSLDSKTRKKLELEGRFKNISLEGLGLWVQECGNVCRSERVRAFLKDFEAYLHAKFGGGVTMQESALIQNQVLSNAKNLEAALLISGTMTDVKRELLDRLKKQLADARSKELIKLDFKWSIDYWERYSDFHFTDKSWKYYKISFSPERTQLGEMCYGVAKHNEADPDIPYAKISKYLGPGAAATWWPWYKNFDEPYYNWDSSPQPWIDILEGKMAIKIIEIVNDLQAKMEALSRKESIKL